MSGPSDQKTTSRQVGRSARIRLMALMRTPWAERGVTTLSDVYDADLRVAEAAVAQMAKDCLVPHPLIGAVYADGTFTGDQPPGKGSSGE